MPRCPQVYSLNGEARCAGDLVPDCGKQGAGKLLYTAAAQTLQVNAIGSGLLFGAVGRLAGVRWFHGVQFAH